MLLAITNAVFVGSIVHAYTFQWTDYKTNNWAGTSATVVKNATYWEVNIVGSTNGGIIIGDPFYKLPFPPLNISPWTIDYQVVSNSNCLMRVLYGNTTNGVTGSNQISIAAGSRTSTTTTFTSPSSQAGINGIGVYRNLGTADCVVRFYSITASDGTLLWSPTQNLDTYSGTLNLTTSSSSGGSVEFPTELAVTTENQQLVNFVLLAFLFFGVVAFIILILRPLYVRK